MIREATLYVTNSRYLDINPPKKNFQGRCTDSSKEIKDHRKSEEMTTIPYNMAKQVQLYFLTLN